MILSAVKIYIAGSVIENILLTPHDYKRIDSPLSESVVEGKTYKSLAVYTFPFTRPGQKNLNGRIYPYELWNKVFSEYHNRSTLGLMNHPEDDGDPKNIWCVWRNMRFNSDRTLGIADCYIIPESVQKTG